MHNNILVWRGIDITIVRQPTLYTRVKYANKYAGGLVVTTPGGYSTQAVRVTTSHLDNVPDTCRAKGLTPYCFYEVEFLGVRVGQDGLDHPEAVPIALGATIALGQREVDCAAFYLDDWWVDFGTGDGQQIDPSTKYMLSLADCWRYLVRAELHEHYRHLKADPAFAWRQKAGSDSSAAPGSAADQHGRSAANLRQ